MDDSKILAVVLIVVAMIGLWLTKEGEIEPVITAIASPAPIQNSTTLGEYALALLVYLFVLSFLSQGEGLGLTVVLVLGALLYNESTRGANNLISTLLKPSGSQ